MTTAISTSVALPISLQSALLQKPRNWLVTGVAGFIGSHLLEWLLKTNQNVFGLDNLATGKAANLENVRSIVGEQAYARFTFVEGSILDAELCQSLCQKVDFVLHQAALGSVARSISDPKRYHETNVTGFLNMIMAARDAKIQKFVYASSSSVYGDEPGLPKREEKIGKVLSPYAATKLFNEHYAHLFTSLYELPCVGLRYFNVFGPRQDPQGEYAAVIPRWVSERLKSEPSTIFGDGTTSRDFCYVTNVVQANLLAALTAPAKSSQIFNVALGDETTLLELYNTIDEAASGPGHTQAPQFADFRVGDVKHSKADISHIQKELGYETGIRVEEGLKMVVDWYRNQR